MPGHPRVGRQVHVGSLLEVDAHVGVGKDHARGGGRGEEGDGAGRGKLSRQLLRDVEGTIVRVLNVRKVCLRTTKLYRYTAIPSYTA